MKRGWGLRYALLATAVGLLLLAGCGGDPEQERIDLLGSNPDASFRSTCDVFLAHVGEKTDWTAVGSPQMRVGVATEERVGADAFSEGCQLGVLAVTLADPEQKETPFEFVFVSVPVYGTWMLKEISVTDASGQTQTYVGDTDPFYVINANQGRHPDHPDYIGP